MSDKKDIRKKLCLPEDKPIIFAPVSGPAKERAFFTGVLRKVFEDFSDDYFIVMSLGYPDSDVQSDIDGKMVVFGWIPNRFEYLKACDVVVSRGGHGTLTQSICYGKPSILVPTPSHTEQFNNAERAVGMGIAQLIKQENLKSDILMKSVNFLLDEDIQEKVEKIQSNASQNG